MNTGWEGGEGGGGSCSDLISLSICSENEYGKEEDEDAALDWVALLICQEKEYGR